MKHVVVFGASGETGRRIVRRALEAGHIVTAVYRTEPAAIAPQKQLRILVADPLAAGDVRQAIAGADVVVHAIGPRRGPGALLTVTGDVMARLLDAMKENGPRRLLLVSAYGTGASRRGFYSWLLWALIGKRMADKERAESMLRASRLEWVVALPTILTNDPPTGRTQAGHGLRLTAMPKISRDDVAEFIVQQVERDEFLGKAVELSGP